MIGTVSKAAATWLEWAGYHEASPTADSIVETLQSSFIDDSLLFDNALVPAVNGNNLTWSISH